MSRRGLKGSIALCANLVFHDTILPCGPVGSIKS